LDENNQSTKYTSAREKLSAVERTKCFPFCQRKTLVKEMASGQLHAHFGGKVKVRVVEGRHLRGFGPESTAYPFVNVAVGHEEKQTHASSKEEEGRM
jgi:hypothetical protein